MPSLSNERLNKLAQAGDTAARDILLESNLDFIRKQEGSIVLLNARNPFV